MPNLRRICSAFACILFSSLPSLQAQSSEAVKIAVPVRHENTYFSSVDQESLAAVEKGSPDSLKFAITRLKRGKDFENENSRVLHYIAVSIMQLCWKSENFSEDTTGQNVKNDYTGAVSSSRNGFYDPPSVPTDFLSYALPSLVLVASETRSDYYAMAQASLMKALSMNPDSLFANYLFGVLCRRQGDFKRANEYFGRTYDMASSCYECAFAYAQSFMELDDPSTAFTLGERLLKSYPQDKELLKLCAQSAFDAGDFTNAELYGSRVLQLEPENSYYLLFRARILVNKGEYIRAASLLDAYARKDSTSRDYLVLRFTVQKNWNRNTAAALATIENALSLYPEDKEIILAAASLASETGSKIGGLSGEELSSRILQKEPDNFEALQIKIQSMVASRKWKEAYDSSSELLKKEDVPNSVLFNHIKICLSAGKKDEAWRYASKLYGENPSSEETVQAYIDTLVSTGRTAEASRLINQLLPNSSSKMKSFLYYERSFISSTESAILADLRSSFTANPRNSDALFRLYRIYYNKKEYRKAQYYLKQVVALSPKDESLLKLNQELEALLKN
ncbi:MAG: tetratricopeptide repeat protein [Treponema sp.]|nr:tetratricopeptide repeat protein [Treponema sp.]